MLVIGIGALISGPMLFLAPDGHLMQLPPDTLQGSPFGNYLVPGIVLFLFVGAFPAAVGYSLLVLPGIGWPDVLNPARRHHWAWSASWAAGVILLVWIAVETALLGYISFLQPLIAAWGAILIALTMLPATRRYCLLQG